MAEETQIRIVPGETITIGGETVRYVSSQPPAAIFERESESRPKAMSEPTETEVPDVGPSSDQPEE